MRPADDAGGLRPDRIVDSALRASAGAVTAAEVDVSDDGATVAFVADRLDPLRPAPANAYGLERSGRFSAPTMELETHDRSGTPAAASSGWPSLSSDGSLVVFGSTGTILAAVGRAVAAPFVVSVDRTTRATKVLIGDADRPVGVGDGLHVAYDVEIAVRCVVDLARRSPRRRIARSTGSTPRGPRSRGDFPMR